MRKILMFICLIVSVQMLGQVPNPTNYSFINGRYRWLGGMFDSGLHVPRYNGVPSGLRSGMSIADGLIAMDTTNGSFYGYRNSAWFRIANYSDIVGIADTSAMLTPYLRGATAGYGMLITGSQHKTWTVDSFSLATRAALYKVSDSLAALIGGGSRFGFSGEDVTPAENRSVDFTSTYTMGLRHLSSSTFDADSSTSSTGYALLSLNKTNNLTRLGTFYRNLTTNQGASLFESHWNSGNPYAQIVSWKNGSSSLSNYFRTYTDSLSIFLSAGSSLKAHNIPSGSAANVLHYDPSTGDITYDAGGGGGISAADLPLRITGSTVSADTSVAYEPSLATNARVMQIIDSLKALGWGAQVPSWDPWYSKRIEYGMWGGGSGFDDEDFQTVSGGTGSSATGMSSGLFAGWMGAVKFITGTVSNGYGHSFFSNGSSAFAQIVMDSLIRMNYGTKIRIDALSDGTDRFHIVAGFTDNSTIATSVTDGVFFRYLDSDSSGNLIMCVYRNGVKIEDATTTAMAINTDFELEISVYQGTAFFYINDALVGSITPTAAQFLTGAGVPYGETRSTGIAVGIGKTIGTTARSMWVDWVAYGSRKN